MNERNAGRKRKFDTETIAKILESYHKGHSVSELAKEYGVSRQTMSFYIHDVGAEIELQTNQTVTSIIRGFSYWRKINASFDLPIEELNKYSARMDFMWRDVLNTSILVDYKNEKVLIKNYTQHPLDCAFGIKRNPSWEDFMFFVEDRCVPRGRDHMKVILNDYGLDFYDPISIVEKTGGRMAGDDYHIKIYSLEA